MGQFSNNCNCKHHCPEIGRSVIVYASTASECRTMSVMKNARVAVAERTTEERDELQIEPWWAFLRAHAVVTRRLEAELIAEQGLSLAEYDALVQLAHAPGRALRMGDLAEQVVLSPSGMTRLVDRLAANGLVERRTCELDGRGLYAMLTDAGFERLRNAAPTHLRGVREHFFDKMDPADLEALGRALDAVADEMPVPGAPSSPCGA